MALMLIPVTFLLSATVSSDPRGVVEAAPLVPRLGALAAGMLAAAALLGVGFRLVYPVVLLGLVAYLVRLFGAGDPNPLLVLVPVPALVPLLTPSALGWFLGRKRKVLPALEDPDYRLPQR